MSIIRMLTRFAAVAALRGRTWADERVFDSDNTPLSQALTLNAAAKPYIVVYTDADNRSEINALDLYNTRRELSLTLEIGVASKVEGPEGKDDIIKTPLTDEGMEIALDMVEDQAMAALFASPTSDWAELLRSIVISVVRVPGQRGASSERDRRWAARQITFVCDVISDLPPGIAVPASHPIKLFADCAEAHPESGMEHGGEICQAICRRQAAPEWQRMQAVLGVRKLGLRAIGLAPLTSDFTVMATMHGDDLTDSRGEAPILREIIHDDVDMEGDAKVGKLDRFGIKTNVVDIKPKEKKDKIEADGNG
jgi:hypothetical protein